MFWISGTTQANIGTSTLDFWLFLLNPTPLSALFAWVYNPTRRSILSPILLYPLSPQVALINAALLLVSMAFTLTVPKGETIELPHR